MTQPSLLSELEFGSFLAYSPRGTSETAQRSRNLTYALKNDRRLVPGGGSIYEYAARRLREEIAGTGLDEFLNGAAMLVPIPRSVPLLKQSLWPAERICAALLKERLGKQVVPCLARTTPLPAASSSPRGSRPRPEVHLATMGIGRGHSILLRAAEEILLVDDVITKGATLLAAATLVRSAAPEARLRAFALVRTRGLVAEIDRILDPHVGRIRLIGDDAIRED